jgi:hypothetical protein
MGEFAFIDRFFLGLFPKKDKGEEMSSFVSIRYMKKKVLHLRQKLGFLLDHGIHHSNCDP